jgi:hypothetical protein
VSATPPEARVKYSRAHGDPEGARRPRAEPRAQIRGAVPAAILGCGLAGALLLAASEFADLYSIHTPTVRAAIQSVTGGSHNSYALLPIAVLVVLLAYGAARDGSRVAMLALGALGVLALLIALIGDLPDAQASGLLLRAGHYETASSSPSVGLYFETLGAVLLLIASGVGFLLGGPPARRPSPTAERNLSAS